MCTVHGAPSRPFTSSDFTFDSVIQSCACESRACASFLVELLTVRLQVSLDKSDDLVSKNPSGLLRIRVTEGYFSRISRIRHPKIVRIIEGPTYRSPTYRGTPLLAKFCTGGPQQFISCYLVTRDGCGTTLLYRYNLVNS